MHKGILVVGLLLATSAVAQAQQSAVTIVTKAEIDRALKSPPDFYDRTLRILDLGAYQLAIAVAKHEPTVGAVTPPSTRAANAVACGVSEIPAGAKRGPRDGISHDDITEAYVIISGSGTLVTGGQIFNGVRSAPDSDTTKIQGGPSCIGAIVGDIATHRISPGDVVVIPAGVPHGWIDVTQRITYLTVRPDPGKVLERGYINPAIKP